MSSRDKVQRKRPRTAQRIKETELCHSFAHMGECRFGESCKYSHDLDKFLGDLAEFYNAQKRWREVEESKQGPIASASAFSEYPHPPFHLTVETAPNAETSVVVHAHKNGVVALCVSKSHPVLSKCNDSQKIDRVMFTENNSFEALDIVAKISVGNEEFEVKTPIAGTLLEINDIVLSQPSVVADDPLREGYLILMKARKPFQFLLHRYFLVRANTNEYADETEGEA